MIIVDIPLTISSAMHAQRESKGASFAVVIFLFLYNATFNLANNPIYCYPTKILPFSIRAKGLGIQVPVSQATLTINQYVNPIALDSIGFYYTIFYLEILILSVSKSPTTDIIFQTLTHFADFDHILYVYGDQRQDRG